MKKQPPSLLTSLYIVVASLIALASCTTTPETQSGENMNNSSGTATIVVYREKLNIVTSGILESWIYVDGVKRIVLKNNYQYAAIPVEAGKHQLSIRGDVNIRHSKQNITIAENETQYYSVENTTAHAVTVNIIPFADMVTTKASALKRRDKKEFDAIKEELEEVSPEALVQN